MEILRGMILITHTQGQNKDHWDFLRKKLMEARPLANDLREIPRCSLKLASAVLLMQTASVYHEKHMVSLSETRAITQAPPYTNISINVTALLRVFFNKYHKFVNQYFMLPK